MIPPFFLDCVVAIGYETQPGVHNYVATGFLYGRPIPQDPDAVNIILVTNRHVFNGHDKAWLRFNPVGEEAAREFRILLREPDGSAKRASDTDQGVDLAVIGLNGEQLGQRGIRFSFFQRDPHVLTLKQAEEAGLSEGDGVFALGFPLGIVGEHRNYVIVRQGAIARIRDSYVGASADILVDISIFPGNSGGPVVTRPEITSIEGTKPIGRAALIGVVAAYVPYRDTAVSIQTGLPRITFEENSGLASVVPADHVIRLAEQYIASFAETVPPSSDASTPPAKSETA